MNKQERKDHVAFIRALGAAMDSHRIEFDAGGIEFEVDAIWESGEGEDTEDFLFDNWDISHGTNPFISDWLTNLIERCQPYETTDYLLELPEMLRALKPLQKQIADVCKMAAKLEKKYKLPTGRYFTQADEFLRDEWGTSEERFLEWIKSEREEEPATAK